VFCDRLLRRRYQVIPSTADSHEPPTSEPPIPEPELARLDAWWRAANYLAVGMIYLRANPLLT